MKKLLFTSLLIAASFSTFAFDFGGSLNNISKFADETPDDGLKLNQKDSIALWVKTPFGSSETNYFQIQGRYQFEHDFGTTVTKNSVNLDFAQAVYKEDELTLSAGRFSQADLSGLVYNQPGDGVSLNYSIPAFNASVYGFYSGLLNSHFVTILDPEYESDSDKIYDLAPKYMIAGARASLPSFLGEQTVSAEGIFTAKLDNTPFTRIYTEASLNGPAFITGTYYDVTGVLAMSKYDQNKMEMSLLSKADIYWYPGKLDSVIALTAVDARGFEKGKFFKGFTSMTAVNSLAEPEYAHIFKAGVAAAFKPVSSLRAEAGADAMFDTDGGFEYAGFQYKAGLSWQIFSEVYAGADISQYFDKNDTDNNKTAITIKASITF